MRPGLEAERLSNQSPYLDHNGERRMLESIVVFADILGFKETIKTAYEQNDQIEHFKHFCEAVDSTYQYLQDAYEYPEKKVVLWQFKSFTDNIGIGFPIERCDDRPESWSWGRSELGRVFDMLSFFQLNMIKHDFFVRGGISLGRVYLDEQMVFGDAFIKAYEAESKKAIYPRIVLDSLPRIDPLKGSYWGDKIAIKGLEDTASNKGHAPSIIELVHIQSAGDRPGFSSTWANRLLEDPDGELFLDYLHAIISENSFDGPDEVNYELLSTHKDRVTARLSNTANDPAIWNKYAWVARYHNYFCDQLSFFMGQHRIESTRIC